MFSPVPLNVKEHECAVIVSSAVTIARLVIASDVSGDLTKTNFQQNTYS